VGVSEADRTQLPDFQAFILSTKNWIITDGSAVGNGRKGALSFSFLLALANSYPTSNIQPSYQVLADGLLVLGAQRSLPTKCYFLCY
jgi:hypothetical protein